MKYTPGIICFSCGRLLGGVGGGSFDRVLIFDVTDAGRMEEATPRGVGRGFCCNSVKSCTGASTVWLDIASSIDDIMSYRWQY